MTDRKEKHVYMVVMKLNFHSLLLGIHTKVNVILPTGRPVFYQEKPKELYQVLWLLHGGTDDCNDFIQNTNICRYAEENKIAVILPEDNDAFFTDGYIQNGGLYFSYVTEELVKMCRSILPISDKREDNFVAGNSMGSGGAMKCAVLFNTLLYIICGIAIQSWILPLYSIVTYYVGSRTVDFITEGFDRAKCAMIVTVEADRISDALSDNFSSSGTIVKAIGGYSKEEKEIVYFIVNRFQINKLKKIVHDIDNAAFISLQEVADIIRKRE